MDLINKDPFLRDIATRVHVAAAVVNGFVHLVDSAFVAHMKPNY